MDIVDKIKELKEKRNAIILAHNYQRPEVQDIADFLGDSLALSIQASQTEASVIVFCGVYFMAETAKILSPDKTVLIPDLEAGCPMADMVSIEKLRELKEQHPNAKVLCYVNTKAEVKSESDVCCTSANSVEIAQKAFGKDEEVIFVPDKYLSDYTSKKSGRDFIVRDGYCPVHADIKASDILELKKEHPEAEVIVHPECPPDVIQLADAVCSTSGMCSYAKETGAKEIIVATEEGIIHRLKKENPAKIFYAAGQNLICVGMKKITLGKVLSSLEEMKYEVKLSADIIAQAKTSIERMIQYKG